MTARAATYDLIKPLIEHCKMGRLFEVQDWIEAGNPVNPPSQKNGRRKKSPIEIAIEKGFYSLVQVLLEGGAYVNDGSYNALEHALDRRRLDIIKLLARHGADINSVDMVWVFDTWDPAIMDFFIDQGADVETGNPLAGALCGKTRTALGVLQTA